ncbi:DUF6059 family protein [Streptomyces sp. NPDC050732]|uniref:DUF6059 family protein n=1 Tax=Streptomyces sp. NPDC050732 TaxID=3154632 RepID=UPI00342045ED
MSGLIRRCWREVYAALQAYGAICMAGTWRPPATAPRELAGPPRAHPERLCPEVALSPVERALKRQLESGS